MYTTKMIAIEPGMTNGIHSYVSSILNKNFHLTEPSQLEINTLIDGFTKKASVQFSDVDSSLALQLGYAPFGSAKANTRQILMFQNYGYYGEIYQYYTKKGEPKNPNDKDVNISELIRITLKYSIGYRFQFKVTTEEESLKGDMASISASIARNKSSAEFQGYVYGIKDSESIANLSLPTSVVGNFTQKTEGTLELWEEKFKEAFKKLSFTKDIIQPTLIEFSVTMPDEAVDKSDIVKKMVNYSYVIKRLMNKDTLETAKGYLTKHGKAANDTFSKYGSYLDARLIESIYLDIFKSFNVKSGPDKFYTTSDELLKVKIPKEIYDFAGDMVVRFNHMKRDDGSDTSLI